MFIAAEIPSKMWIEAVELSTGALRWQAETRGSTTAPTCDPIGPVDRRSLGRFN
ncbi:hypothetical protein [Kitasatospora sp. NPDC004289]